MQIRDKTEPFDPFASRDTKRNAPGTGVQHFPSGDTNLTPVRWWPRTRLHQGGGGFV
jgi:hypothetical protein